MKIYWGKNFKDLFVVYCLKNVILKAETFAKLLSLKSERDVAEFIYKLLNTILNNNDVVSKWNKEG